MRIRSALLPVCIVLAGLALATAGAGATGPAHIPADHATVATAQNASNTTASVRLERSVIQIRQDETTSFQVVFNGTDTGTLRIGDADTGFRIVGVVTDGNNDGTATLRFDATGAGPGMLAVANDADSLTVTQTTVSSDGPLAAGNYPISLYLARGTDGEPSGVGTLIVRAASRPEGTVSYEGDALTLANRSGAVVSGTTALETGRTVTVRLRSTASASPFLIQKSVTVTEDGEFTARFDLSDIDAPAEATATIAVNGTPIVEEVPVEITVETTPTTPATERRTTDTPDTETSSAPMPPGQPGFGTVLALVAILLALLARTR